jgi:hypothetical protein
MFGKSNDTGQLGLPMASEKLFQQLVSLLPDTSKRLQLRQVHISRTMLARFQAATQPAGPTKEKGKSADRGKGNGKFKGKGKGSSKGKGWNKGKDGIAERGRVGDWICGCGALCFASRTECYKCAAPGGGSSGKRKGKGGNRGKEGCGRKGVGSGSGAQGSIKGAGSDVGPSRITRTSDECGLEKRAA